MISALQSMAVFVLLFAGGMMVLNGKTAIGIVVAFISGLERILEPCREMIAFVRSTSAARVQFDLIRALWARHLWQASQQGNDRVLDLAAQRRQDHRPEQTVS
jgi:ABC-type bacteriocin/lantibiotic exporter with double-glycine peptidase domain